MAGGRGGKKLAYNALTLGEEGGMRMAGAATALYLNMLNNSDAGGSLVAAIGEARDRKSDKWRIFYCCRL